MNLIQDAIAAIQAIVNFIEKVDPNAANNVILQDLSKALAALQAL
jgi:hypothetical protein